MAVDILRDDDTMTLVARLRRPRSLMARLQPARSDEAMMQDLNAALDAIQQSLGERRIWHRAIDPTGAWSPGQGEFAPSDRRCLAAWAALARRRESRQALHTWFDRLAALLQRVGPDDPIHEAEDAQLGEFALSVLATRHLEFVPVFQRFLDLWDLHHAVHTDRTIADIVKAHGRSPETESLVLHAVVAHAGDGDLVEHELRPILTKLYGDFTRSDLLRRMVTTMHAETAGRTPAEERYIFRYTPSWPELGTAVQSMLAELDARA